MVVYMTTQPEHADEILNQLLHEAAAEKDRAKWIELLRKINRVRAEKWLKSPKPAQREPRIEDELEILDIFMGVPDSDAVCMRLRRKTQESISFSNLGRTAF
jgi:hypothetical protein